MKNLILFLVLLIGLTTLNAQDTNAFKSADALTMFGVDYSQTYFVGKEGFNDAEAIADDYLDKWNNLFLAERDKFSLEKNMKKSTVDYSLSYVEGVNEKITEEIVKSRIVNGVDEKDLLTLEGAKELALSYNLSSDHRFGIIFFASQYSKLDAEATYHAVIVDTKSNTVDFATTIKGDASGFGFRNYWANSFNDSLGELKKIVKKLK